MTVGLGYTPAKPTSPPTIQSKFVDKRPAEKNSSNADAERGFLSGSARYCEEHHDRPLHLEWSIDPDQILSAVGLPKSRNARQNYTMAAVVHDAIVALKRNPGVRTSYSRNERFYADRARYLPADLMPSAVIGAVDYLVDVGFLIEHDKRPQTLGPTGIQSSYLPSPQLLCVEIAPEKRKVRELVQLKDAGGRLVQYRDTKFTDYERRFAKKINAAIAKAEITFDSPNATIDEDGLIRFAKHAVAPDCIELYRVYNQAWTLGGRFYGGYWQSVNKHERKFFCIDGEAVYEEDYSQIHPSMLYRLAGVEKEGDAYAIPGFDRDFVKKPFNTMVNAPTWHSAHGAITNHMGGDRTGASELILAIKQRHPKIEQFFHTGLGLKLMNFDSLMCRKVLDEMTIKRGIVCLPVHDSFIVGEQHKELLGRTMSIVFDTVMKTVKL